MFGLANAIGIRYKCKLALMGDIMIIRKLDLTFEIVDEKSKSLNY